MQPRALLPSGMLLVAMVGACTVGAAPVAASVPDSAPAPAEQTIVSRSPFDFEEAARAHIEASLARTPGNQAYVARVKGCNSPGYNSHIHEMGYEVFPVECAVDVCAFGECTDLRIHLANCGTVVVDELASCSASSSCGVLVDPAHALASAIDRLEQDALQQLEGEQRVSLQLSELGGLAWVHSRGAVHDGVPVFVTVEVDASTGEVVVYRREPEDAAFPRVLGTVVERQYLGPLLLVPIDAPCPRSPAAQ